jgi:soluble lytic murein transglycosylase-like protein
VYESKGGAKLITDQPRREPGYRLIKTYGATDNGTPAANRTLPAAVSVPREPMPSFYDELIRRTARRHQVDHHLVKAVMHVESGFNNFARSRAGAQGLMQLMPGTADRYGVANVYDARANVDGAVRYLRDLLVQFNNDRRLALAGYNAGENAVVRHGGIPPYAETVQYVSQVLELHRKYQASAREQKLAAARPARSTKGQDVALNSR